jgi:hypothetical protein
LAWAGSALTPKRIDGWGCRARNLVKVLPNSFDAKPKFQILFDTNIMSLLDAMGLGIIMGPWYACPFYDMDTAAELDLTPHTCM